MRTSRNPSRILFTSVLILALVATACAPAAPGGGEPAGGQPAGELVIGQPTSVSFVDPQKTYLSTEAAVWHSMYDSLAFRMPDLTIAPGLAKSWQVVTDTEWQLKLQEGVKFHNGEVFDAATVKWNVERVIVPGFQDFAYLADLAGAEVVDQYTVKIRTKTLIPTLPGLFAVFTMIPPTYFQSVGQQGFNQAPVGTGPYKFVEWKKDSHITLEANTTYWNKVRAPTYQKVTWRFLPDSGSRVAALRAGEVHIIKDLPADDYDPINATANVEAVWVRSLRTPFFRFFPASPQGGGNPFADVRVRQAFNHAINVDAMMKALLGGRGHRTATLMTPEFAGYDESIKPYEYDPQKAKQLLTEAGYPNGFTIKFETWSAGPAPKPVELAQAAAADLAKVGVTANVVPVEVNTSLNNQNAKTLSPFHLWSWGAGRIDCWDKHWGVFHPRSSANFLVDQQVVSMIDELNQTADPAKRNQTCKQLQQRVRDLALIVSLFAQPDIYGKRKDLNWKPRSDELILPWEVTPKR